MTLVEDITLEIEQGEFVAIMGPSGSGTSSLLYSWPPRHADLRQNLAERDDTQGLSDDELADIRLRQLGFVFQFHFLLAEVSALDNVLLPIRKLGRLSQNEALAKGLSCSARLGLGDQAASCRANVGGQRQRVAVARRWPTIRSSYSRTSRRARWTQSSETLRAIFRELSRGQKRTVVAVTHDPSFARRLTACCSSVDGSSSGRRAADASPSASAGSATAMRDSALIENLRQLTANPAVSIEEADPPDVPDVSPPFRSHRSVLRLVAHRMAAYRYTDAGISDYVEKRLLSEGWRIAVWVAAPNSVADVDRAPPASAPPFPHISACAGAGMAPGCRRRRLPPLLSASIRRRLDRHSRECHR